MSVADPLLFGTSDSVIIREELEELDQLAEQDAEAKRELVLRAAAKLEMKYSEEPATIGRKLVGLLAKDRKVRLPGGAERVVFARVSRGWLYEVLPPKYTREYDPALDDDKDEDGEYPDKDEEQEEATTQMMEFMDAAAGAMERAGQALRAHSAQLDEMRRSARREDLSAVSDIVDSYAKTARMGSKQLADYIAKDAAEHMGDRLTDAPIHAAKEAEADWSAVQRMSDKRVKFSTATRLLLRMIFQFRHYGDVANKINHTKKYGAKWLSSIDRDSTLAQFVDLVSCPNCHFDFELWMERAKERNARGLDIPVIGDKFCRSSKPRARRQ